MKFILASVACLGSLALVASHGGSHVDCGFPGISRDACEATGQCAYNSGLLDEPSCHYKFACAGGAGETACKAAGCVWDPEGAKHLNNADWQKNYRCYHPNTKLLPPNERGTPAWNAGTKSYKI